jgi:hypothetical protein
MRQAEHRGVRYALELGAHGGIDARVAVAVHVAPERRHAVDVAAALDVDQVGALGTLDDQRWLLGPASLLGERVPKMGVVGGGEIDDPDGNRGCGRKGTRRIARR